MRSYQDLVAIGERAEERLTALIFSLPKGVQAKRLLVTREEAEGVKLRLDKKLGWQRHNFGGSSYFLADSARAIHETAWFMGAKVVVKEFLVGSKT